MGQIRDGQKKVAVAGTRERLVSSSTPAMWVKLSSLPTNAGANAALWDVVVGGSTVVQAPASRRGVPIDPVSSFEKEIGQFIPGPIDLTDIWLDVGTANNGACFIYMEP